MAGTAGVGATALIHVETQTGNIHIRNASTDQNLQYLSTM